MNSYSKKKKKEERKDGGKRKEKAEHQHIQPQLRTQDLYLSSLIFGYYSAFIYKWRKSAASIDSEISNNFLWGCKSVIPEAVNCDDQFCFSPHPQQKNKTGSIVEGGSTNVFMNGYIFEK